MNLKIFLPVCHGPALVLNSGWQRLERDGAPQALDVLGDDAVVKGSGLDSKTGLRGRSEAEVGEADTEQGLDIFGGLEVGDGGVVVVDVVVGVVARDRQPVRDGQLVVAAVVRVDEGEEAERRLRRCQMRRRLAVGAEEVGDGRPNFPAAVARLHRELHDQLGPSFLVDGQPMGGKLSFTFLVQNTCIESTKRQI